MDEENSRYYTAASSNLKQRQNPGRTHSQLQGYTVIEIVEHVAGKKGQRTQLRLGLRIAPTQHR